ncbi:unnamed protein product [Fraxinus pennsylvanica]|uniref:NPH3 domain-containing protein n=1 Tax=Fraxinus pennsylvanica TaxID=56036 RepID=A0AAD2DV06_9LAMI|nr:unnamed protein product [Fraxinus pennsylvanica]
MKIDSELLHKLERRIALMLEGYKATDLLVKSSITLFNVDIIDKALEAFVSISSSNSLPRSYAVRRLVNEYLVLVATYENLPAKSFQLLVEVLPKEPRNCEDNFYRAMDMYLKAHPNLTEEERRNVCSVLENHKQSQDAHQHATKNERLPTENFSIVHGYDGSSFQQHYVNRDLRNSEFFSEAHSYRLKCYNAKPGLKIDAFDRVHIQHLGWKILEISKEEEEEPDETPELEPSVPYLYILDQDSDDN